MAVESKSFPVPATSIPEVTIRVRTVGISDALRRQLTWAQVIVAFLFVECAVWAARLSVRSRWAVAAGVLVVAFALVDRPSVTRLGLRLPNREGAIVMIAISLIGAAAMVMATQAIGGAVPANPTFPNWHLAWKYVIWALVQQFLLQSFFFTRFEELFGSSRAVWVTGTLFAATHLPNPVLTATTLLSGLAFCELFRRYRSIYPLAVAHAILGLTLALTVPEALLQHMRVGIGYLR
jgi:membrane protease YdiL (CAAX protease family)